jgi:repressor LexA
VEPEKPLSLAEQYRQLPIGRGRGLRPTGITPRQRFIFEFIVGFISEHGRPPNFREIAAALGVNSNNAIEDHLKALVRHGLVARDSSTSSQIRIVGVRWQPVPEVRSLTMAPEKEPNG